MRPWPTFDTPKKKRLGGTVVGAGIAGGAVAIAIAEVSRAPSAIELRRSPDGQPVAKGRYPMGEAFVALAAGVLVTRRDAETVNVWRLVGP